MLYTVHSDTLYKKQVYIDRSYSVEWCSHVIDFHHWLYLPDRADAKRKVISGQHLSEHCRGFYYNGLCPILCLHQQKLRLVFNRWLLSTTHTISNDLVSTRITKTASSHRREVQCNKITPKNRENQ